MGRGRRSNVIAITLTLVVAASAHRKAFAQPPPRRSPDCERKVIGPLVANVPSVQVQPQFRLNGKSFPAGGAAAELTLWASDFFDGPQLTLGRTDQAPQPVRVMPGVYDVYYSWLSGKAVPRNPLARVRGRVHIRKDGVVKIDVPMVQVSGVKQHNGVPFAEDGSGATLSLRSGDVRDDIPLGGMSLPEFSVRIIPGTYAVQYDWDRGTALPRNRHATVRQLRLSQDVSGLVVDVPSVVQDFTFLHNGEPFPATEFDHGDIVLTRPGGEDTPIGPTYAPPPTVRLIPGAYDARWRHVAGASVPRNEDAEVGRGVVVDGSPLVIDVPSIEISGDVRLNGQAPPDSEIENGLLSLSTPGPSGGAYLTHTRYGAYQVRVLPGIYDVVYSYIAGSAMPANVRATLLQGWDVAAKPHRTLDIPVGTYQGVFLLNGEPFPGGEVEKGSIYVLPLPGGGEPVNLGTTYWGAFYRRLLPGFYRTAYAHEVGASVPANTLTIFGPTRQVFPGDMKAPADILDVRAATLTVSYEHNGVPLLQAGPQLARIYLHRGDNHLQLEGSEWGPVPRTAMEGRFDLFYEYREGPGLPHNKFMPFACWNLVR